MLPMTGVPAGSPSPARSDPLTDRGWKRRVSIPLITTWISDGRGTSVAAIWRRRASETATTTSVRRTASPPRRRPARDAGAPRRERRLVPHAAVRMHDVGGERANGAGQTARPQHGNVRQGPVLVELCVPGETFGKAAEVAERQDVALESIRGEQLDESADQPFQAAVIELVHHVKNLEASCHRPEDRMTNPFSDNPAGMFSRGTAQRFTWVGGNQPPPRTSAAA